MSCGISVPFETLSPTQGQVTHALLTRSPLNPEPKPRVAFDLHVLGTPPALILSQDQTLMLRLSPQPSRATAKLNREPYFGSAALLLVGSVADASALASRRAAMLILDGLCLHVLSSFQRAGSLSQAMSAVFRRTFPLYDPRRFVSTPFFRLPTFPGAGLPIIDRRGVGSCVGWP